MSQTDPKHVPPGRRCSVCGLPFNPETSSNLPFCGFRCRQIDLGRWLDEAYGLPYDPPMEEYPPEDGQA